MSKLHRIIKEEISRFLGEVAGTPKSIEGYVEEIEKEFTPLFMEYIDTMVHNGMSNYDMKEIVDFKYFNEDFPMDKLKMQIEITINPNIDGVVFEGGINSKNLRDKDGRINPTMSVSVQANPEVSKEKVEYELDSFLTHEVTHLYELYKRGGKWGDKSKFLNYVTTQEINKNYPDVWKYLLISMYETIDHEVNARVSQVAKKAQKLKGNGMDSKSILEKIKSEEEWEILEKWESFSPAFYIGHVKRFLDQSGYAKKGVDYKKFINAYKKNIATTFDNENMELTGDEIKFLNQTEDMGADEFLSHWEKVFKREAKGYRRKMLKAMGSV
jgi:hypothetical protein